MKILIAGDSWGRGEWNTDCTGILHAGISQYLTDDGHLVENLSHGGLSNLDIVNRIKNRFDRYNDFEIPDIIMIFQTEYCRDFKHDVMQTHSGSKDWVGLEQVQDLIGRWVERFYMRLSEISTEFKVPIKIIGGCSDTMHFDNMSEDYPGCDIVCQSTTNLIVTGDHRVSTPVFSWYTKNTADLVKKIKANLPPRAIQTLMDDMDRGFQRECLLKENPEFFWPDGRHPNRQGHQILFNWLKDSGVFG